MDGGVKIVVGDESGIIRALRASLPLEMNYGTEEVVDVLEIKDGMATLKNVDTAETRKVSVKLLEAELRYRNVDLYKYMTSRFKGKSRNQ